MYRIGYLFKETGNNLRRNPTLFLATVIAVWVSLAMLGSAIIVRAGVSNASGRWSDDIEIIVFMNPDATDEQMDAVARKIDQNPEIELAMFVDKEEAFQEMQDSFGEDSPELVETLSPEMMPPSYRIRPLNTDADIMGAIARSFENEPGVRSVSDDPELLRSIERTSQRISTFILVTAIVVLIAAVLLIVNTIRTAVFSRRNDIEIMKLVGASNWYIRVPFVIEGTVQGLVGGLLAVPMLFILNSVLRDFVSGEGLDLLKSLVAEDFVIWNTSIWMVLLGAGIGALGSGIVVGRYVDV